MYVGKIARPTAHADWWDAPDSHVLGGRDLERPEQGTWLGITRQGRIACLTNFREQAQGHAVTGLKSRGGIVNSYLKTLPDSRESTEESAARLIGAGGFQNVGGFSLLFGQLRRPDADGKRAPLAVISNRTPDVEGVTWVVGKTGEVHGLSNSFFGDLTWPKVIHGEQFVKQSVTIHASKEGATQQQLVDRLFEILSIDTLPKREAGAEWDTYLLQLRNSIFIPRVGGEIEAMKDDEIAAAGTAEKVKTVDRQDSGKGVYGTQKQTVLLVDNDGHVTFIEKTLSAANQNGEQGEGIRKFEFDIEGW